MPNKSRRFITGTSAALTVIATALPAQAVTLTGTIRDFCAPSIAGSCTALTDFEGPTPGVVTGMVMPTLVGGLPAPGPSLAAGGSTVANFAKWYVDSPGFNLSLPT